MGWLVESLVNKSLEMQWQEKLLIKMIAKVIKQNSALSDNI